MQRLSQVPGGLRLQDPLTSPSSKSPSGSSSLLVSPKALVAKLQQGHFFPTRQGGHCMPCPHCPESGADITHLPTRPDKAGHVPTTFVRVTWVVSYFCFMPVERKFRGCAGFLKHWRGSSLSCFSLALPECPDLRGFL